MDTSIRKLFDPAVLPPRDAEGFCCHPDLQSDRWNLDGSEEIYDRAKFAAAGFEIEFIEFEHDATEELSQAWFEGDSADISSWTPSPPSGDGWILAGIWDAEDGPIAFYVREAVTP